MEKIKSSRTQQYSPADVLINKREPYNKNVLWIDPIDDINYELKLFNSKWKTIYTTKDLGLSPKAKESIDNLIKSTSNDFTNKLEKFIQKFSSDLIVLNSKLKDQGRKILELEDKIRELINNQPK